MRMKSGLMLLAAAGVVALGVMGLAPGTAQAVSCGALGWAGDCNLLITINPNGTVSTSQPFATPYDGVEDQFVGVFNNSSLTLTGIRLSGVGIFDFDGDGAYSGGSNCSSSGSPPNPCGTGGGTTGYERGGINFFSDIVLNNGSTPDTGIINFIGNLSPGQLSLFSLEDPASVDGVTVTALNATPEPATLLLVGTTLSAAAWRLRRRPAAQRS